MTWCSIFGCYQRFGGIYYLYLQCIKHRSIFLRNVGNLRQHHVTSWPNRPQTKPHHLANLIFQTAIWSSASTVHSGKNKANWCFNHRDFLMFTYSTLTKKSKRISWQSMSTETLKAGSILFDVNFPWCKTKAEEENPKLADGPGLVRLSPLLKTNCLIKQQFVVTIHAACPFQSYQVEIILNEATDSK